MTMKKIPSKVFFKLCKGSKLQAVKNYADGGNRYSIYITSYIYKTISNQRIQKDIIHEIYKLNEYNKNEYYILEN